MIDKIKDKINILKMDTTTCKKLINNYVSIKKVQELNENNPSFKKINDKKKKKFMIRRDE